MPTPTIRTSTSSSRGSSISSASIANGSDFAVATAALICMGILPVRDRDPRHAIGAWADRQCRREADERPSPGQPALRGGSCADRPRLRGLVVRRDLFVAAVLLIPD